MGALAATRLAKQGWEVHVSPPWHCMKFTLGQSALPAPTNTPYPSVTYHRHQVILLLLGQSCAVAAGFDAWKASLVTSRNQFSKGHLPEGAAWRQGPRGSLQGCSSLDAAAGSGEAWGAARATTP